MSPLQQRVLTVAKSWLKTPYHHMGTVRGAGCDCATLLWCVYRDAKVIEPGELEYYPMDWHVHSSHQRYMEFVQRYANHVPFVKPQPADVILWQYCRAFAHGAIVIDYPTIIHSVINIGVVMDTAERPGFQWTCRPRLLFRMRSLIDESEHAATDCNATV